MVRWGAGPHLWDVAIFECLIPETAVDVFVAIVTRGVGELSEEDEPCVRNLIAGVNVAELVTATLPDANPDSKAMVQAFSVGLLGCMVQKSLRQPFGRRVPHMALPDRRPGSRFAYPRLWGGVRADQT